MPYLPYKTAVAAGIVFAMTASVQAADSLVVDGYAKSSSGETWTSSSGECIRTTYEDTKELLGACGYEVVVTETVVIDNQPAGVDIAAVEKIQIVKSGAVLVDKEEILVESFIQNLEFDFDSAKLTAADQRELDRVIAKLDPYRQLLRDNVAYINTIGYTDSTGPETYNQKLSERRARSVADYLENPGSVRSQMMKVSGRGEADPIGDNGTKTGRELNRRVVIEVVKN